MAELEGTLTTTSPAPIVVSNEYTIRLREVNAAGSPEEISIVLPTGNSYKEWSLLQRAALLKKTTWKASNLSEIMFACLYADSLGLDIVAGDIYSVDGRLNTTTGAKIKHALNSGRIAGYSYEIYPVIATEDGPVLKHFATKVKDNGIWTEVDKEELECKVTVHVKDWNAPFVYTARLSEWYMPANPNWGSRTQYMLAKSAVGHALDMVVPMGAAESDEAPVIYGHESK